jgi:hypothetical protein
MLLGQGLLVEDLQSVREDALLDEAIDTVVDTSGDIDLRKASDDPQAACELGPGQATAGQAIAGNAITVGLRGISCKTLARPAAAGMPVLGGEGVHVARQGSSRSVQAGRSGSSRVEAAPQLAAEHELKSYFHSYPWRHLSK